MNPLTISLFLLYVFLTFGISWYFRAKGKRARQQFLINDHKLGLNGMVMSSVASTLDSVNIIFAAGIAFIYGTGAFLIYLN